ncbi:hypothetical protein EK904_014182 [Melospiza melodia maxima]|nr:hypothetical protein EK904_014182 [Melospiza melodia maxima]
MIAHAQPFSKLMVICTSAMDCKDQQHKYESAMKTDSSSRRAPALTIARHKLAFPFICKVHSILQKD